MEEMKFQVEKRENVLIYRISGDLREDPGDVFKLDIRKRTVSLSGAVSVIIDMSDVPFINSEGMALLLGVRKTIASRGGTLIIISLPEKLNKLFNIGGLDKIIPVFSGLDEGMNYLGKGA